MRECSKSITRRLHDSNFLRKYIVGNGIDIGGKPDPLELYTEFFPLCGEIRTWDWEDGDAQFLETVEDGTYDFLFSSHCLEHLKDPFEGIRNWLRVIKPGGHLVVAVPDEDLYEQGEFPSTFNTDHKFTFTIGKSRSWSDKSVSVLSLLQDIIDDAEIIKIEQINYDYRYDLPRYDRTGTPVGECCIEFILRKRDKPASKHSSSTVQPPAHLRTHYNQYQIDRKAMIDNNSSVPPFSDDSEL